MGTSQIRHLGIVDEGSEPVSLIAAAAGGDVRAFEQLSGEGATARQSGLAKCDVA